MVISFINNLIICVMKEYFILNWFKAKRAVATCTKFKTRLQQRLAKRPPSITAPVDYSQFKSAMVEELNQAEIVIIKLVQADAFQEELNTLNALKGNSQESTRSRSMKRTSPLFRLDPFIDDEGVLRVGGRLRQAKLLNSIKHPVILPRKGTHLRPYCCSFS